MARSIKRIMGVDLKERELYFSSFLSDSALEGYYRFEADNPTLDSSGNGRTLTASGTPTDVAGKFQRGRTCTYGGATYSANTNFGLGTSNYTVMGWVKVGSLSQDLMIMTIGNSASSGFAIYQHDGQDGGAGGKMSLVHCGVAYINIGIPIPDLEWHHWATTRNSSNVESLYLDGLLVWSGTTSAPTTPASTFYITGNGDSGSGSASFDDVAIFSRVLTTAEIQKIAGYAELSTGVKKIAGVMNAQKEIFGKSVLSADSGLRAYYKFDDNGNDSTSNGYNLTGTDIYYKASSATNGAGKTAQFNGSSSNYRITSNLGIANKTLSMGCFFYHVTAPTSGNTYSFLEHANNTTDSFFQLGYRNVGSVLQVFAMCYKLNPDVLVEIVLKTSLATSTWYHVMMTSNGTNFYLYVNGVQVASGAVPANGNYTFEDSFNIGRNYFPSVGSGPNQYLNGYLDEVVVFNRLLSSTEVRELYSLGVKKIAGISNV